MKKLIIALLMLSAFAAEAQYTTPRFGIPPSGDNTGRTLNYSYATPVFASKIGVEPNAYETIVKVGKLTGAQTDTANVTLSHVGDKLIFIYNADTLSAGRVVTFGTNLKSAGTLTIAASKRGTATFIFDGAVFIEQARAKE